MVNVIATAWQGDLTIVFSERPEKVNFTDLSCARGLKQKCLLHPTLTVCVRRVDRGKLAAFWESCAYNWYVCRCDSHVQHYRGQLESAHPLLPGNATLSRHTTGPTMPARYMPVYVRNGVVAADPPLLQCVTWRRTVCSPAQRQQCPPKAECSNGKKWKLRKMALKYHRVMQRWTAVRADTISPKKKSIYCSLLWYIRTFTRYCYFKARFNQKWNALIQSRIQTNIE